MILIIGTENCSKCNMVKGVLSNKGIKYEYKLFDSLSDEERQEYLKIAEEANVSSFPLIFKENKLTTLEETVYGKNV